MEAAGIRVSPSPGAGFGPADMDRPIFLDKVLGLETATMRQIVDILLKRTYCGTLGVEFMHISDPDRRLAAGAHRGPGQGNQLHPRGQEGDPQQADRGRRLRAVPRTSVKYTGTKRFGLDGGEALIPALEQIIKRGGAISA
jgi:2-oxoglutarate dehydrogenase E1 component